MNIIKKHDTTKEILRNTKFKHGNLMYLYADIFNVYIALNWIKPFILYGSIIDKDTWYKQKSASNKKL